MYCFASYYPLPLSTSNSSFATCWRTCVPIVWAFVCCCGAFSPLPSSPFFPHFFLSGDSVFVANLDFGTNEDDLRDFFRECGTITGARILRERDSGRSKG